MPTINFDDTNIRPISTSRPLATEPGEVRETRALEFACRGNLYLRV